MGIRVCDASHFAQVRVALGLEPAPIPLLTPLSQHSTLLQQQPQQLHGFHMLPGSGLPGIPAGVALLHNGAIGLDFTTNGPAAVSAAATAGFAAFGGGGPGGGASIFGGGGGTTSLQSSGLSQETLDQVCLVRLYWYTHRTC
jgi:hypothetical protein